MTEQLTRAEENTQKREYWKRHIEKCQASGMSQTGYCRQENLSYYQFGYWKKRLVQIEKGAKFVSLDLGSFIDNRSTRPGCPLRLVVSDGFTIEVSAGFDPQLLRQLIVTLRGIR